MAYWHTAHLETVFTSYILHICTSVLNWDEWGFWQGAKNTKEKLLICTMAVSDRTNWHRPTFTLTQLYCITHNPQLALFILSLLSTHAQTTRWGLHTQDTGVYIIPKDPDVPLLECKVQRVQRVGCQFEESHFATMFHFSPNQPVVDTWGLWVVRILAEVVILHLVTDRLGMISMSHSVKSLLVTVETKKH